MKEKCLLDKVRELETDNKELKEQNAKFKREKQEVLGSLFGEDFVCGNGAKHHGKDYDNMCLYCEIESLRLRAVPDWGKPGVVPEGFGRFYYRTCNVCPIFIIQVPEDKTQYCMTETGNRLPLSEFMGGNEFQFSGPVPMPREKE